MNRPDVMPNVLTACGLCCGLFVIFTTTITGAMEYQRARLLVDIILLAAILDVLDGALARALNGATAFGGFFDSMSDGIAFGVAPALLIVHSFVSAQELATNMLLASGAMYVLAGVLRLVRFSVNTKSIDGAFEGLPITAAAMGMLACGLFLLSKEGQMLVTSPYRTYIASSAFVMLSYLMVSRWRFPSLKAINIHVGSTQMILTAVLLLLFLITSWINNFAIIFLLASWGYISLSWIGAVIHHRTHHDG